MAKIKKVECASCGAKIDETVVSCPYCGSIHYPGAEADYMKKLKEVHRDLQGLEKSPAREWKSEFVSQLKFVGVILLIASVVAVIAGLSTWYRFDREDGNAREEFLWKMENYPVMQRMLEDGQYDELLAFYKEADDEGKPVYGWSNRGAISMYDRYVSCCELLTKEAEGISLTEYDYRCLYDYETRLMGMEYAYDMSDEAVACMEPYRSQAEADFRTRWGYSDEEIEQILKKLEENRGWISYEVYREFVAAWYRNKQTD